MQVQSSRLSLQSVAGSNCSPAGVADEQQALATELGEHGWCQQANQGTGRRRAHNLVVATVHMPCQHWRYPWYYLATHSQLKHEHRNMVPSAATFTRSSPLFFGSGTASAPAAAAAAVCTVGRTRPLAPAVLGAHGRCRSARKMQGRACTPSAPTLRLAVHAIEGFCRICRPPP